MMRAIVVALIVSASVPRLAAADESGDAEQLYNQGQAAFDATRYDDAVTAWQKSFELSHEPGLLFNLGQAYRLRAHDGDCARAAAAYRKFIAQDPMSPQRSIAEGFASDTEKCAAAEKPVTTPAAPVQPPIGPRESGSSRLGRTTQIAGIAVAAGGVALVATGLYFGHQASSLGDEVSAACADGCDWAVFGPKDAEGRRAQRKQYIAGGLGIAAIAGGAVLFWLGSRTHAPSPIAVVPRPGGAGITWSGSW